MHPAAPFHPRLRFGIVARAAAAFVEIESVVDAAVVPLGVTVLGEKAHDEATGNPEQAKLTC